MHAILNKNRCLKIIKAEIKMTIWTLMTIAGNLSSSLNEKAMVEPENSALTIYCLQIKIDLDLL